MTAYRILIASLCLSILGCGSGQVKDTNKGADRPVPAEKKDEAKKDTDKK